MDSRLLIEGFLDVKVPKGNNDRKLWKVWRQQWMQFSVVNPITISGEEPVLQLQFAQKKSRRKPIRIGRAGLRIFRCQSRSRPYRTWALALGSRPLLFLAAESEARAQEWMRALREGLWPPSLAQQMLSACSYEVSLLDDENSIQSDILGAYGHLVTTPDRVLSLMHPHWGSVLLQIPLTNIQSIVLVREDRTSLSGVLEIFFKSDVNAPQSRTLQFYSDKVKDTIQWILSKLIDKDIDLKGGLYADEQMTETGALYENLDAVNFASMKNECSDTCLAFTQPFEDCELDKGRNQIKNFPHHSFTHQTSNRRYCTENDQINDRDKEQKKNYQSQSRKDSNISEPRFSKQKEIENSCNWCQFSDDSKNNILSDCNVSSKNEFISTNYAVVCKTKAKQADIMPALSSGNPDLDKSEFYKAQNVLLLNEFPFPEPKLDSTDIVPFQKDRCYNDCQTISCISSCKGKKEIPVNIQTDTSHSAFNTTPTTESNPICSEDIKISPACSFSNTLKSEKGEDNWDEEEFTNHIYEHVMERKGTIYEEVDNDDDLDQNVILQPPQLPERPQSLQIPSSSQLLKLSHNINKVLEEMAAPPAIQNAPSPKLVRKIKETGRIMYL